MCCACKGQNLHLEELVIKTQQEMTNLRIADGLCGQGERGWQVRTCCSGGCCALFPPLWLSSMIKEMILVIPAAVHILKLFGMLTSKPTPSCIFLTPCVFFRGESAAHIIYLKTFLCWSKWRLLWWRLSHKSSWLLLCNGNQAHGHFLLWNFLSLGTFAPLSRWLEASPISLLSIEEVAVCSLPFTVMCCVRSRTCYWGQQFSNWLPEVWHRGAYLGM